jgi:hypothetical protein
MFTTSRSAIQDRPRLSSAVPLYQRTYQRGPEQLHRLWEDVAQLAEDDAVGAASRFFRARLLKRLPDEQTADQENARLARLTIEHVMPQTLTTEW